MSFRALCNRFDSPYGLSPVDMLLAGLLVMYCLSAVVNRQPVTDVCLQDMLPYLLLYTVVRLAASLGRKYVLPLLFLSLCIWSCTESVSGLMQVLGRIPSGHFLFRLTGSFDNPGPYGGFIAMTAATATAFAVQHRHSAASQERESVSRQSGTQGICIHGKLVFLRRRQCPELQGQPLYRTCPGRIYRRNSDENNVFGWRKERKKVHEKDMKTVSEIKGCNKQKNFCADRLAVLLSLWISMATFPGEILAQQTSEMTLDQVIEVARHNSVEAIEAKSSFVSDYWAYRSYKASRLPSLNLYGNLASFDRSLRQLQNFETGELVYTGNYNMQNSLGLSVVQNLPFTGGTLSLYTDLSRIDQFGADFGKTWYAQPVTFEYEQPLLSYNRFKWEKKISPKKYEYARRMYIESMEQITIDAVTCYFDLMLARKAYDTALSNYENTKQMFSVAAQRLVLGSVTKDEYLQLELRMLNDSISINETAVKVKEAQMQINSLLGYDERMEIIPVAQPDLPDIWMDYDMVMTKAMKNSSFRLDNEIKTLTAESDIAQAKADRGASVSFRAKFGLSNSDAAFRETYKNLVDQEVVGITFSIPIFDWGLGRGRVKEAEAHAAAVKAQVEQAENDYRRQVYTAVGQFNSQRQQCMASERASRVALERYSLVMDRFRRGTASVTELNTAQSECDTATEKYIEDLSSYWNCYYAIRQLTLFDFIGGKDIEVDFEELIK